MSHPLFERLRNLDTAKVAYTLSRNRPESILVSITTIGQRIEIDVFHDRHMEVCRFVGNEGIEGGAELIESIIDLAS